jgi:hypothetical protein
MTQRQVLRQLAEAGQLQLQDFDAAGLTRLLRQELITVAGQTVTLTDKGRRLAAPKKPPRRASKPPRAPAFSRNVWFVQGDVAVMCRCLGCML